MKRQRDLFYVNANFSENYFIYYGMEFKEFVKFSPISLENIMLTEGNCVNTNFNRSWFFETANGKESILKLSKEDIYRLGNFSWVDYSNETDLNSCTPEERAELLYLSHFCKPVNSPFFNRIDNKYVYLAHDDGWFCKLYCKEMSVFKEIIANKAIDSFSAASMDEEIKRYLFELTSKGLVIDFSQLFRDSKSNTIDYYIMGVYEDMDHMYNNFERSKQSTKIKGSIKYNNDTWNLIIY